MSDVRAHSAQSKIIIIRKSMSFASYLAPVLICILFAPTLKFGTMGIPLNEVIVYAYTILFFLKKRKIVIDSLTKASLSYLAAFLVAIVLTSVMSQTAPNGFDVYQIRLIVQLACLSFVTQPHASIDAGQRNEGRRLVLIVALAASPAILTFLQYYDILGIGVASRSIYNTFEGFLSLDDLSEIRVASVFRSYFNATVYFFLISSAGATLALNAKLRFVDRSLLLLAITSIFIAQIYTGRTGLVSIPVFAAITYCISVLPSKSRLIIRLASIFALGLCGIGVLSVVYESGAFESLSWAAEPVIALLNGESITSVSSVSDMQGMNERFYAFLANNLDIFLVPRHAYDLDYTMSEIYTDSYYFQELYRYGIYGAFAYLVLIVMLCKAAMTGNNTILLFVLICFLIIFNYKGGNVFIMEKTLYGFVIAWRVIQASRRRSTSRRPHSTSSRARSEALAG